METLDPWRPSMDPLSLSLEGVTPNKRSPVRISSVARFINMQVFAIWHQAVHRLFQGENSTARPLKPCPPIMTPGIPLNRGQNWKAGEVMPQQTGLLLSVRFLLDLPRF